MTLNDESLALLFEEPVEVASVEVGPSFFKERDDKYVDWCNAILYRGHWFQLRPLEIFQQPIGRITAFRCRWLMGMELPPLLSCSGCGYPPALGYMEKGGFEHVTLSCSQHSRDRCSYAEEIVSDGTLVAGGVESNDVVVAQQLDEAIRRWNASHLGLRYVKWAKGVAGWL